MEVNLLLYFCMADKNIGRTAGNIVWRIVIAIIAIWLVIWMLRISGIHVL